MAVARATSVVHPGDRSRIARSPVTTNSIGCPGPETEGLQGVPPVAGTTTVYAAGPPSEALQGVDVGTGPGSVSLAAVPAGTELGQSDKQGTIVLGTLTGASAGLVTARGPLAPGLAALQTTVSTEGDDRAGVAAPCAAPKADLWLVAGGGGSTRRERVVLTNPGANPVSADVTVRGDGDTIMALSNMPLSTPFALPIPRPKNHEEVECVRAVMTAMRTGKFKVYGAAFHPALMLRLTRVMSVNG